VARNKPTAWFALGREDRSDVTKGKSD